MSREAGTPARSLVAAIASAVAGPLPMLLAGTLAVQLDSELGVGARSLGVAVTTFFVASTVLSVPAGRAADRLGWRSALRVGALGSAACLVLVALLAKDAVSFTALLLVGTIGHALAGPSGNLALSEDLPPARHGLVFGVKQSANPIAGMFAGAAVPVFALSVGWRWAFVVALAFPLVALAAACPTGVPGGSRGVRRRRARAIGGTAPPGEPLDPRPLVALAVLGGFASMGANAVGTFVLLTVVDSGVGQGTAGVYVLVGAFLGMMVRIVSGWWADRRGSGGLRPIASMLVIGAGSYLMLASGNAALALPAVVLAYTGGWGWPGLYMFSIARHYGSATGRVTGIVQLGLMGGSAAAPLSMGVVVDTAGYGVAWTGVAIIALVGAIAALYAARVLEAGAERAIPRADQPA